jgi:hypothetical protein
MQFETWSFTTYGFPLYVLLINVVLFSFAALPLSAEFRHARAYLLHAGRLLTK